MATRNQRERRAPERYGVTSFGKPFDGENSDLELEEEEIEQAGELGLSTNPLYSSSEDEVEEPQRKRRRRGRERTESSSVCEHLNSSESDGNDTDSSSNLFAEDSNDEDFEGFRNRTFQWREPFGEINPPPACVQATGAKTELPEDASLIPLNQDLLRGTSHNMYPIMKKDSLRSECVQCAKLLGGSSNAHLCAWIVMWDFV